MNGIFPTGFQSPNAPSFKRQKRGSRIAPAEVFMLGNTLHHLATTAYPIGHRQTFGSHRRDYNEAVKLLRERMSSIDRLGLYIHIPFCERRCRYCEYTVLDSHNKAIEEDYERLLLGELSLYASMMDIRSLKTVGLDFGGGTPTIVNTALIGNLLTSIDAMITRDKGFEISIETTPKIAAGCPGKLKALRRMGIERISMGIQTTSTALLTEHNRDYNTINMNSLAAEHIFDAGFRKFNVDIMYGFARQTLEDLEDTIDRACSLYPHSITAYRVRYKGTSVAGDAEEVSLADVQNFYVFICGRLKERGYTAQPGKNTYSRIPGDTGLSAYLRERVIHGTPYLGFGLGAQSFTASTLSYNCGAASKKIDSYRASIEGGELPLQDFYLLPREEGMAKMIAVAFYNGAIHLPSFKALFGISLEKHYTEEVSFALACNLMEYRGDSLALTEIGARFFNGTIALFYSDPVKNHLLAVAEERGKDRCTSLPISSFRAPAISTARVA